MTTPTPDPRPLAELAGAVASDVDGFTLAVTPWEYREIVEHRASPAWHADVWTIEFRQALADRFVEFGWSQREVPAVRVVVRGG